MERDNRDLVGKQCVFNTTDSELLRYDGQIVSVRMRKDEKEYDFEDVGSMYEIEMSDTSQYDAFADELELV